MRKSSRCICHLRKRQKSNGGIRRRMPQRQAFMEKTMDFYMDYLDTGDVGLFLSQSIKSYLDGQLGKMEDRLGAPGLFGDADNVDLAKAWMRRRATLGMHGRASFPTTGRRRYAE